MNSCMFASVSMPTISERLKSKEPTPYQRARLILAIILVISLTGLAACAIAYAVQITFETKVSSSFPDEIPGVQLHKVGSVSLLLITNFYQSIRWQFRGRCHLRRRTGHVL